MPNIVVFVVVFYTFFPLGFFIFPYWHFLESLSCYWSLTLLLSIFFTFVVFIQALSPFFLSSFAALSYHSWVLHLGHMVKDCWLGWRSRVAEVAERNGDKIHIFMCIFTHYLDVCYWYANAWFPTLVHNSDLFLNTIEWE